MKNKIKGALVATLIILSILTIIIFVNAKKGGDDELPCSGPLIATSQSPSGWACYVKCGAPAECEETIIGGKGPLCDYGEVCNDKCECVWVDRDLDGASTTSCTGNSKWISLGEVDVLS